jgi:hypothetical protein
MGGEDEKEKARRVSPYYLRLYAFTAATAVSSSYVASKINKSMAQPYDHPAVPYTWVKWRLTLLRQRDLRTRMAAWERIRKFAGFGRISES